jgi:hypothetical protein
LRGRNRLLLLPKEEMKEGLLRKLADENYHRQTILGWFRGSVDVLVEEIMKSNPRLKREVA